MLQTIQMKDKCPNSHPLNIRHPSSTQKYSTQNNKRKTAKVQKSGAKTAIFRHEHRMSRCDDSQRLPGLRTETELEFQRYANRWRTGVAEAKKNNSPGEAETQAAPLSHFYRDPPLHPAPARQPQWNGRQWSSHPVEHSMRTAAPDPNRSRSSSIYKI